MSDLSDLFQDSRRVHPRTAVGLPACRMHVADLLQKVAIGIAARTRRSIAPRVVAAGADAVKSTQLPHRDVFLGGDEGEDIAFRSEVNAIAFFKRSCSSLSCS